MNGERTADRVAQAIARIDAAAARIAAAADTRSTSSTGSDPELEARYAALQREAGEALQQIDRLLMTMESS
ncbi:hypothetical protein [Erythrobacter alti]|uniref:hypothetical protein n=1 Tax=Erythrobacter alti TaxID=1896145 RepID=UPI0030F396F1